MNTDFSKFFESMFAWCICFLIFERLRSRDTSWKLLQKSKLNTDMHDLANSCFELRVTKLRVNSRFKLCMSLIFCGIVAEGLSLLTRVVVMRSWETAMNLTPDGKNWGALQMQICLSVKWLINSLKEKSIQI